MKKAGENLLDMLGGTEAVIDLLADSTHPKAQALIDRMRSTAHFGENFATAYNSVGLKTIDIVTIFGDRQQARTFINAISESDDMMRALIRAGKDQLDIHAKCKGSGWVLDKAGRETDDKCLPCHNTGYVLKPGARDAQDLYFTLINWKKSGGMTLNLDARRQSVNFGNGGQTTPTGFLPGQAPEVLSVIKRADQIMLTDGSRGMQGMQGMQPKQAEAFASSSMPEDGGEEPVVEAEVVGR